MKLYKSLLGKASSILEDGRAIIETDSGSIRAFFCLPDESVQVLPRTRRQGCLYGEIETVLEPSPDRLASPPCKYAQQCGGCAWQFINYPRQLALKKTLINQAFSSLSLPYSITEVIPARELFYYRNRMDYVFGPNGELGLKAPGKWFSYLDLQECHLLSPASSKLLTAVGKLTRENKLHCYNPQNGTGCYRYLVIREGKNSGDRLVIIIKKSNQPTSEALIDCLRSYATDIIVGINDSLTDISSASSLEVIEGNDSFHEIVSGIRYEIPCQSFFQTNTLMAEELFKTVTDSLVGARKVLDLYCGVGFFALGLARQGIETLGIESDPIAISAAKRSALANQITKAEFLSAKSEALNWTQYQADAVIVDPPRAGLHPKVIASLLAMRPQRLIYISCKYSRFVQELPSFLKDYEVSSIKALDLFPQTPHVELVTTLTRKDPLS